MTVEEVTNSYNLDRKSASKLLKVSLRTVDRYAKAGKVSTQVVDGRVWFDKAELLEFKADKGRSEEAVVERVSTSYMSTDGNMDNVDSYRSRTEKSDDSMSTYKKLYEEAKKEINEKQERLEMANYRVGQLEAQLRNSVPLLEYTRENSESKKRESEYERKIEQNSSVLKKMTGQLRYERFSKRLFIVILLTVLALQPLWLLMFYD